MMKKLLTLILFTTIYASFASVTNTVVMNNISKTLQKKQTTETLKTTDLHPLDVYSLRMH